MTVALAQKKDVAENAAAERLVYADKTCAAAFSAAFGNRQSARHSDRREESQTTYLTTVIAGLTRNPH